MTETTENEMEESIAEAIWNAETEDIKHINTYAERGILTNNAGLVITMNDGTEFRVTIVKSR